MIACYNYHVFCDITYFQYFHTIKVTAITLYYLFQYLSLPPPPPPQH